MRTPIRIREAAPDDVADIVTLIAHLGYPVREEALQRTLELLRQTPGHAVLVAEAYGAVCGLLVLSTHPSLTLQGGLGVVQELVVRPTQRRREIGESLLQYAARVLGPHDVSAEGGAFPARARLRDRRREDLSVERARGQAPALARTHRGPPGTARARVSPRSA